MKPGKTGLRRIWRATGYSMSGLAGAWRNEAAFRQEVVLAALLAPVGMWLGETGVERVLLVGSLLVVLVVELLNTAVEMVVDRVGKDHHDLSGLAKDAGSAAVFLSLCLAVLVWLLVLGDRLA